MRSFLRIFLSDQSGQDMLEYAVIAAIVSLGAIAAITKSDKSYTKALKSLTKSIKSYA